MERTREDPRGAREEPERSPRGAREEPRGAERSPRGAERSREEPERSGTLARLVLAPGSAPRPSLQVRIYRHHNEHSHEEYEGERSAEASLLLLPRHFLDTS